MKKFAATGMNDLVLPKQEQHGGYAQDSIGSGTCSSTMFCGAIDIMKKFAATGMNDLVLPKQEQHGGYARDSIIADCNSGMGCIAINKMKDFVTDITKNRKCKPDALVLIQRYGNLLRWDS
ncbi:unnamed protein product [Rotaria sordida]|nr:unnamed protein product [Rotaria sordida]